MSDIEIQELYAASYRRLLGQLIGVTGSVTEAEDVVQEAFVRGLDHPRRLLGANNPEAWLRTVAVNLARSRWRRAQRLGRDKAPLRDEPGDFGGGAVYSPDGTSLVFQADLDGGCIYRSDARARHLTRLTQGCSEGFVLDWSPNGEWIVWAGGPHGPADAEVMAADGSQRHTIVDDSSVAYTAWQPRPRS